MLRACAGWGRSTRKSAQLPKHMDSKTSNPASSGGILRDDVMVNAGFNLTNGSGCSGCTVLNNLMTDQGVRYPVE
jgi:hypothetical protein